MPLRTLLLPVAMLGLLAACGDNSTATSGANTPCSPAATDTTIAGARAKPLVKIPAKAPTELVTTDLTDGTGTAAVAGDTLIVYYIGVRTANCAEFDNSYDRGAPLSVTIGAGQVIKGWDQGLAGMKVGGRRQLDIPAALAYGDAPPSTDVIQPGDALTFVVDAVAIIAKPDPADIPNITIQPAPNQADQTFTDLIVGDGVGIDPGQTVAVQLLAFSAADGKQLDSSWESGSPLTFVPGAAQLPPGIEKAVEGMKVGGRRQVIIPFAQAFGEAGNADLGLPASTDLIMVLDLVAVY
ncbi:MAG: FKBP-type peptidyl-prolyl cis-trans isomerase [Ilumatobacteraceae bacterium]